MPGRLTTEIRMPRRNRRERYEPRDLTPPEWDSTSPSTPSRAEKRRKRSNESDFDRMRRQAAARVDKAIDWSVCVVPGCGRSLVLYSTLKHDDPAHRDSTMELPICYPHAGIVWNMLVEFHTKRGEFAEAIADVNERIAARDKREATERKERHLARIDGDIYFIRIGGMIKAGWTRDLWSRVKSYGASAELLCCYSATREDETTLHRQLRPALAKGREWYEDGPIVQAFIEEAFVRHGASQPVFDDMWTKPKQVVAGKRSGRG